MTSNGYAGSAREGNQVPVIRWQTPVVSRWLFIEYGLMSAPVGWTYFLLVKPASTGRVTPVT